MVIKEVQSDEKYVSRRFMYDMKDYPADNFFIIYDMINLLTDKPGGV